MFVKATREKIALKLAITGPSGSGKTMSALRLANGLGKKIAVIDTENNSASLYADVVEFDVAVLTAPYTVRKYVEAIKAAESAGYEVIVIDSLSHEWAGEGGLLDQKTAKEAAGKNGFTAWGELGQQHELLKSTLLQANIHIIVTMRSKQDYVLEQGANGKTTPRKVGMAPIQRDGMEYEFTTVWDVDAAHRATTSKDRTGLFVDEIAQIAEEHGTRLMEWLKTAKTPAPVGPTIEEMKARIKARASELGYEGSLKELCPLLAPDIPLSKWTTHTFIFAFNQHETVWKYAIESLLPPASEEAEIPDEIGEEEVTDATPPQTNPLKFDSSNPRPIRYQGETDDTPAPSSTVAALTR